MKIERNSPCYCGSKKKYKKCHYLVEWEEKERQREEKGKRMMRLNFGGGA